MYLPLFVVEASLTPNALGTAQSLEIEASILVSSLNLNFEALIKWRLAHARRTEMFVLICAAATADQSGRFGLWSGPSVL